MPPKRVRAQLIWSPCWDDKVKKWTTWYIKQNIWRCDKIHEVDDLLQDAYLLFIKIEAKYPRVVQPGHFMALYKTALKNQIHDQARYVQKKRAVHADTSKDVSELYAERIGEVTNFGYLQAILAEAPEELKLAMDLICVNPDVLRAKIPRATLRGYRENLNMRLRRVLGIGQDFDFTRALRSLLSDKHPPRPHLHHGI